jgi:hypothetical protein
MAPASKAIDECVKPAPHIWQNRETRWKYLETPILHNAIHKFTQQRYSGSWTEEQLLVLQPLENQKGRLEVICHPEELIVKLFAQPTAAPTIQAPARGVGEGSNARLFCNQQTSGNLLCVPALPPSHDSMTVQRHIAVETKQFCTLVGLQQPHAADLSGLLTFHDLIAPAQVLSDTFQALPLVVIEDDDAWQQGSLLPLNRIATSLQLKAKSLATTELLLDWSLTDPHAPDPSGCLDRARKKLQAAFTHETITHEWPLLPDVSWKEILKEVTGTMRRLDKKGPEQLPAVVARHMQRAARAIEATRKSDQNDCRHADAATGSLEDGLGLKQSPGAPCPLPAASRQADSLVKHTHGQVSMGKNSFGQIKKPAAAGNCGTLPRKKPRTQSGEAAFFFSLQAGEVDSQQVSSSDEDSLLGRHVSMLIP